VETIFLKCEVCDEPLKMGFTCSERGDTYIEVQPHMCDMVHNDPHQPAKDVDVAYDGVSNAPQERPLTARERDIICRIYLDLRALIRHQKRWPADYRLDPREVHDLEEIFNVLNPRKD
jgi:hypothetical protein